jgi:hypothetical protein
MKKFKKQEGIFIKAANIYYNNEHCSTIQNIWGAVYE